MKKKMTKRVLAVFIVLLVIAVPITFLVVNHKNNNDDTKVTEEMFSDEENNYDEEPESECYEPLHQTEVPDGYVGIYSFDDLDYIRNMSNGSFILMNDIDMSNNDWNSDINLSGGVFDGNNYSVTFYSSKGGLFDTITNGSVYDLNLFATINAEDDIGEHECGVLANCVIKGNDESFSVNNVRVNGKINSNKDKVGGLFGNIHNITKYENQLYEGGLSITKCSFEGEITNDYEGDASCYGGLVGYNSCITLSITNCFNYGSIDISNNNKTICGGIIGSAQPGTISNCINYGSIQCSDSSSIGGICGDIDPQLDGKPSIDGSINIGSINDTSGEYVGGIVGTCNRTNITNCLNKGACNGNIVGGITAKGYYGPDVHLCVNIGDIKGNIYGGILGDYESGGFVPYDCFYLNTVENPAGIKVIFPYVHSISIDEWNNASFYDFSDGWTKDEKGIYPNVYFSKSIKTE